MSDFPSSGNHNSALGEWIVRYRWLVLFGSLALAMVAGSGGSRLAFNNDYRVLFSEDNPELQASRDAAADVHGDRTHPLHDRTWWQGGVRSSHSRRSRVSDTGRVAAPGAEGRRGADFGPRLIPPREAPTIF